MWDDEVSSFKPARHGFWTTFRGGAATAASKGWCPGERAGSGPAHFPHGGQRRASAGPRPPAMHPGHAGQDAQPPGHWPWAPCGLPGTRPGTLASRTMKIILGMGGRHASLSSHALSQDHCRVLPLVQSRAAEARVVQGGSGLDHKALWEDASHWATQVAVAISEGTR